MGDTIKEALAAARGYRRATNPFLQWIKEDMEEGKEEEGFDYEAKAAFKDFVTYMREQNPKYHTSKEDFRSGMEALGFAYGRRTVGKIGIGRYVFKGLRPRQDESFNFPSGAEDVANVFRLFPTGKESKEK
jgi:phage/plasmid-associated DNA primase